MPTDPPNLESIFGTEDLRICGGCRKLLNQRVCMVVANRGHPQSYRYWVRCRVRRIFYARGRSRCLALDTEWKSNVDLIQALSPSCVDPSRLRYSNCSRFLSLRTSVTRGRSTYYTKTIGESSNPSLFRIQDAFFNSTLDSHLSIRYNCPASKSISRWIMCWSERHYMYRIQ